MLTISTTASQAIRAIVSESELDDEAGLRIAAGPESDDGQVLAVDLRPRPEEDDVIVDGELGTHVFLDGEVAPFVDDMVLDADFGDRGVRFTLLPQAATEPSRNGSV